MGTRVYRRVAMALLRTLARQWAPRLLRTQENRLAGSLAVAGREYKTTTGIVGVEVAENAQYRVSVEMMAKERLSVVEKDISPEQMEDEIGCGQLEELILHAQDELSLIPKMVEWKPWEVPEGHKIKMVVDDEPVPLPEEEK